MSRVRRVTGSDTVPHRWPISAGANLKVVQRLLGHATAAMTPGRFGQLFDNDLAGVAKARGKAIEENAVYADVYQWDGSLCEAAALLDR